MNPEQKSSGLRYQWPSAPLNLSVRRALALVASREERGHWGILTDEDLGMLANPDPSKWPVELKQKLEKLHDLFEEELRESGLPPSPWLFTPSFVPANPLDPIRVETTPEGELIEHFQDGSRLEFRKVGVLLVEGRPSYGLPTDAPSSE